jgi:hypothetical protein
VRAVAPNWVLEALNGIDPNASIGFEDGADDNLREISRGIDKDKNVSENVAATELVEDNNEEDEVQIIGDREKVDVIMQSIDSLEEVWHKNAVKTEVKEEINAEEHDEEERGEESTERTQRADPLESGAYVTRSGRVSRPPQRLIETSYAVLKEVYRNNFSDMDNTEIKETIEVTYMMKVLLFQKAVSQRPEEAMMALTEEVTKAVKIDIWEPVHLSDLTDEEKKLIIPQMMNYLEKYKPDKSFDKFKVRVLTRGDMQKYVGENKGPVARVESLLMLLSIAVHLKMAVFKVDIGSAFMHTTMVEDVKHKWVKLDKLVVQILRKIEPGKYEPYMQPDGTVIVRMNKISYGYVEAAHYWWKDLSGTFFDNGYNESKKYKCIYIKKEGANVAWWIQEQIAVLKEKYEEVTIEIGEEINLIGMNVKIDYDKGRVVLMQPKHVARIIEAFGVNMSALNPALASLMGDDDSYPVLDDQKNFMSLCAMLMFVLQRTYLEICPAAVKLSTKYNKATELDMLKAKRVAEYIYGSKDSHCLVLAPKSLNLVSAADASYAEHVDGKSHSGGTIGFETETSCNFAFVSSKQPVVAKSAGEAELIAQNKVGEFVEWARELLEELGYPQEKVPMEVDSTCAMQMMKQGTGSFKQAKHIKVRFFWLKELIDQGQIELVYTHTDELVADILMKPLSGWKFQYLLYKLIGWNGSNLAEQVMQVAEEVCWIVRETEAEASVQYQYAWWLS